MLSVMSQSDSEMSTHSLDMEVDVLDCYSPDLTLLCWISHSKSPPKGNFPLLISFNLDSSLIVIFFTLTLPHMFSGS